MLFAPNHHFKVSLLILLSTLVLRKYRYIFNVYLYEIEKKLNYYLCNLFFILCQLQIMKLTKSILGEKLFTMLMKGTFYGHFVAGEDQIKIVPTLER